MNVIFYRVSQEGRVGGLTDFNFPSPLKGERELVGERGSGGL